MKTLTNLRIIGDNNASGGSYNDAKIIGDGSVNGNLDCSKLKCVGNSRVDGNVKGRSVKVVGSLSVSGSLETEEIKIIGNLDTGGDIKAEDLILRGGIEIKGKVQSDHLKLTGYTTIKNGCEAETFQSEGPLSIGGLLSADEIDIKLHGRSKVAEIGGEQISIRCAHYSMFGELLKSLFVPTDSNRATLVVESIEGDSIRLQNTKAKIVRGNDVVIGDGCEISLIEYSGQCRIFGKSTVKEKRKTTAA